MYHIAVYCDSSINYRYKVQQLLITAPFSLFGKQASQRVLISLSLFTKYIANVVHKVADFIAGSIQRVRVLSGKELLP